MTPEQDSKAVTALATALAPTPTPGSPGEAKRPTVRPNAAQDYLRFYELFGRLPLPFLKRVRALAVRDQFTNERWDEFERAWHVIDDALVNSDVR